MKVDDLRRFERLYQSAKFYAANVTARRFLSLCDDDPVPLSIAHGVDFGHTFDAMDVHRVEPIHWACSPEILERAARIKTSVMLPHPWALQTCALELPKGTGTLLVGPPPGPANDLALYELIKTKLDASWSILVKPRGNYEGSLDFWKSRGVTPVVSAVSGPSYYEGLAYLLGQYRRVVSPTMSSVLFFAATVGREVGIIRNYKLQAFDSAAYEEIVDLHSPYASQVAAIFASDNRTAMAEVSSHLLGYDMLGNAKRARHEYLEAVDSLVRPLHSRSERSISYRIREALAITTGKAGFLNLNLPTLIQRLRGDSLCIMTVDQFDVLLNGKSRENFNLRKPTGAESRGSAGTAVVQYFN